MSEPTMIVGQLPPDLRNALKVWVIYRRPRDLPHVEFVVRAQYAYKGVIYSDPSHTEHATLADARRTIPRGLVRFDERGGDPVIVESWL